MPRLVPPRGPVSRVRCSWTAWQPPRRGPQQGRSAPLPAPLVPPRPFFRRVPLVPRLGREHRSSHSRFLRPDPQVRSQVLGAAGALGCLASRRFDGPQRDVGPRRGPGRRPPQSLSGRRLRGPAVLAVPRRGGRRWEGARVPRVGTARPADLPARCFRVPPLPRGLLTARSSLQLPLLVRLFPPSETLCTFSGESLEIPVTRCLYFHKAGAGEVALVENLGQCAHTLLIL